MRRVEGPRSLMDPLIDPRIERLAAGALNAGQPVESMGVDAGGRCERGAARPRIEPLIEGSTVGGVVVMAARMSASIVEFDYIFVQYKS